MQAQINCPRCQTPFTTEVFQIIDAQHQPELKQMLLMGALNVAVCPNCNYATQLATPLLYHDSEHELLMVHVPMEMNLPLHEQEKIVGQLTKAITDSTDPSNFRAYMLQPETIITMKTFMEKVYATEGITPEMLERQQNQMQLMQELMAADKETSLQMIEEKKELIDESFFAILQSTIQSAQQSPQAEEQMIALTNLQARLYTKTEVGRQVEQRQMALRKFQQAVNKQGGLTYELFAEYLLKHKDDDALVNALLRTGQDAISYELLTIISNALEEAENAGNTAEAEQIKTLRGMMVEILDQMQEASEQLMIRAKETLDKILAHDNINGAIMQHMREIDQPFMYYLSAEIDQAEATGNATRALELKNIQNHIIQAAEQQMPPELQLINKLIKTEDKEAQRAILNNIPAESRPQFIQMLQSMSQLSAENDDPELTNKVADILQLLQP